MFDLKDKLQDLREGLEELPSASALFSLSAALSGWLAVLRSARTIADELIPPQLRSLLVTNLGYLFSPIFSTYTLVIKEYDGYNHNELYDASELFLRTRITPSVRRLEVMKVAREKDLVFTIDKDQVIVDVFEGIEVRWRFIHHKRQRGGDDDDDGSTQEETRSFELRFRKNNKEKIVSSYLPHVLDRAKAIQEENKILQLHTNKGSWSSVNLDHPATFDTLAMDHKLKREIIEDLDRFVRRREFYKTVGKAWKRGYLLYGPPGTGKSSLIAAMANYLKFDVYDLELANIRTNSDLRSMLVATANRSILVIEDIDCSVEIQNTEYYDDGHYSKSSKNKFTLSSLLNFIDGLWSSCGDERIIIFTTNYKDRLDPALLRPGRMDRHIHLSYCTTQGFNILASNYLGIHSNNKNKLYSEIENSIEKSQVTPAEVAEELMKSEDPDIALGELIQFLKRKRIEQDEPGEDKDAYREPKRRKTKTKNVKKKTPAAKRTRSVLKR